MSIKRTTLFKGMQMAFQKERIKIVYYNEDGGLTKSLICNKPGRGRYALHPS